MAEIPGSGVLFSLLDLVNFPPSVANLDPLLTINGVTVAPILRYRGAQAGPATWRSWGYGEELVKIPVATPPTYYNGSPFYGSVDTSVRLNASDYYQAKNSTFADITAEDIIIECVMSANGTDEILLAKRNAGVGYEVGLDALKRIYVTIQDAGGSATSTVSSPLEAGHWNHVMIFLDRSGSGFFFLNGANGGGLTDISARNLTLTNTLNMTIGAYEDGTKPFSGNIALINIWIRDNWLDTYNQLTIAKERFAKLVGVYPSQARGTPTPVWYTLSKYIDKYEANGTRKLYLTGYPRWPRICERQEQNTSKRLRGYLSETYSINKCLQSQAFATTWTKLDAGDTITENDAVAPNGLNVASTLVADATDGDHGVSQDITLTAVSWVISIWAKAGNKNWLYVGDDTVANATGYFDLSPGSGSLGTMGAGINYSGIEEWCNNWYRCYVVVAGTAASHTIKIQTADADNDKSIVGDGATVNTELFGAQVEIGVYPFSYNPTTTAQSLGGGDSLYYDAAGNMDLTDREGQISCKTFGTIAALTSSTAQRHLFSITDEMGDIKMVSYLYKDQLYYAYYNTGSYEVAASGSVSVTTGSILEVNYNWEPGYWSSLWGSTGSSGTGSVLSGYQYINIAYDSVAQLNNVISDFIIYKKPRSD